MSSEAYSSDEERVEFDCPHCGMGFTLRSGDAIFTDHIRDECSETCMECGKEYQLRCIRVECEMECTKANKDEEQQ